ncbi:MAG: PAS domain S-box protein [Syntrophorhabdales bacterium]
MKKTPSTSGGVLLKKVGGLPSRNVKGVRKLATDNIRSLVDELQSWLAAIVECSDDAIVGTTRDGIVLSWNHAAEAMYGYSAAEMRGQPISMLVPPGHADEISQICGRIGRGEHVDHREMVWRRKDGSQVDVSLTVSPVKDAEGAIVGISITGRNITESKRAQERLREYQKAVEGSRDMIAVVDRGYRYLLANEAFLAYRGMDREEVLGRSVPEVLGRDVFDGMVREHLDNCFQGKVVSYEMNYTYPGLGERNLLVSYFPIEEPGGVKRVASVVRDATEYKRAEAALRESEERFRLTFDQSPTGAVIADPSDFQWIRANKAFCDFTGYSEEELTQLTYMDITHPDDMALTSEQVRRLIGGEISTFESEKRYIRKDGSIMWGHLSVQAVKDGTGRVLNMLGMIQDITERKHAEQALRESEQRYRAAIEHSNDGVVITKEGRHVYVNQRFLDMFGYNRPDEVIGTAIADAKHVHPEDRAWLAEMNQRRPKGEPTPPRYGHRAIGKDGNVRYIEASATRIVYQGEPASLSYLRDVTERKQAELRLRDSEEALKSLLNATNDVACLMDREGTIIAANTVLAQRVGRGVNDLIGQNIFDLLPREVARSRQLWAQKVVESGKPVRFEDISSGNRYFDSCVYPVLDAEGNVVRLAVYARDITEVKQASRALAESEARFEQLFDNVNDGIAVRDARTFELLDANRRFSEMWGYTLEELKALPVGSLGADQSINERRSRLIAYYGQVAKGLPGLLQWGATRKDGSIFWVELNGTKISIGNRECLLLVVRDVTERKEAEERIRVSLEEKEVLLKEIHHRVKNNLQIVSSLLYLQATRTEHPGAVSALRESRARIKSMALIHERLYRSPDLASVDMGEYTRNLVSDLQHSQRTEGGSVRVMLNVGDITLGITEAIPCGLIINELVSNSLKHAFPEGRTGEVTIQLARGDAGSFTLMVGDNVIGLPEHVDFRKSPSLGLTLINSLVDQLDGTIKLDRGNGTSFTITFG